MHTCTCTSGVYQPLNVQKAKAQTETSHECTHAPCWWCPPSSQCAHRSTKPRHKRDQWSVHTRTRLVMLTRLSVFPPRSNHLSFHCWWCPPGSHSSHMELEPWHKLQPATNVDIHNTGGAHQAVSASEGSTSQCTNRDQQSYCGLRRSLAKFGSAAGNARLANTSCDAGRSD